LKIIYVITPRAVIYRITEGSVWDKSITEKSVRLDHFPSEKEYYEAHNGADLLPQANK